MALITKTIKDNGYYYSFLSYFLMEKPKSFSKYIGRTKPASEELARFEDAFRDELIRREAGRDYTNSLLSKDGVIRSLLFSKLFEKKYEGLTETMRRKYDIDSMVKFTLTTLTTEEVDIDLADVENALKKASGLSQRERISRNMLKAVELIRHGSKLDQTLLLNLHRMIMSTVGTKSPGAIRKRQVYLYRKSESGLSEGTEVAFRPPDYRKLNKLLSEFFGWYDESMLNPLEKAAMAHYELYKIHPFLDGNKRVCRLIYNKILIDNGFPLINISLNKDRYFDALVISVEKNDPKPFIEFAVDQYYIQVRKFLGKNRR